MAIYLHKILLCGDADLTEMLNNEKRCGLDDGIVDGVFFLQIILSIVIQK